jgi:hypothetical protein
MSFDAKPQPLKTFKYFRYLKRGGGCVVVKVTYVQKALTKKEKIDGKSMYW